MKNEHTMYAFFSVAAGFAANYFFIAALYKKSGILKAYGLLPMAVWANTIVWVLIAFLFYKKVVRAERIRNILFLLSFIQILFILTVCLDRFAGVLVNARASHTSQVARGLIFEANTSARYKTSEIDFEIKTNSIGLRNEEIDPAKAGGTRIVCLGDSWTMGWGVNLEQSWPKVMERYFAEQGYPAEVINCGQGGQYTTTYKKYLKRILPALKPGIVVIGVLQADDLAQLYENHYPLSCRKVDAEISFRKQLVNFLSLAFQESYKNIISLGGQLTSPAPMDIHETWRNQARQAIAGYTRLQAVRYETFDDTLREMFEQGDLNVSLVNYDMFFPERMLVFNDPHHKATQFAMELMKRDVAEMKDFCDRHGCTLVFVNLPNNCFTGHKVVRNPTTDPLFEDYLYTHNQIDSIYRNIAESSNVAYLEMTDVFKNLQPKDKYFYLYDGHPTPSGYEVMGRRVGQYLMAGQLLPEKRE